MSHYRSTHEDIKQPYAPPEYQATQPQQAPGSQARPQWLQLRNRKYRRAPVWTCADSTDDGGAECKFCRKYYIISQGSTSNLLRHLENNHSEEELVKKMNERKKEKKAKKIEEAKTKSAGGH